MFFLRGKLTDVVGNHRPNSGNEGQKMEKQSKKVPHFPKH